MNEWRDGANSSLENGRIYIAGDEKLDDVEITIASSRSVELPSHPWKPSILQDAELMQNVMQDHKNLHLAE